MSRREADSIVRLAASGEQPDQVVRVVGDQVITATPSDVGKVVTVAADGSLVLAAGGGGGVTDHGDLTGLSDADHPIAAVTGLQAALDAKAPLASPTFTGITTAPEFSASGLTGATAASRYVGGTTTGPPTSGTFAVGDFVVAQDGFMWVCKTAGTPGTWSMPIAVPTYTVATLPAASAANASTLAFVSDLNGGTLRRSNGSSWVSVAPGLTEAPAAHKTTHLPNGSDAWTAYVRKTADETVTSSAALQDDDHLVISVAANEVWRVELVAFYEGVDAEDIAFGWSFPAGAAGTWGGHGLALAATSNTSDLLAKATPLASPLNAGGGGAGVIVMASFFLLLRVSSTGGTLRLQWAQRVSGGTGSILKADSYIYAVRVA